MCDRKKRILIVDDERGFTRLLKMNLEDTGDFEVRTENQPGLALAAGELFRPDLILLDVMMPGVDGGDLADRFQRNSTLKQVPIVFITAAVRKDEVHGHGGRIGGLPFLAKPVELPEVLTCIRDVLGCGSEGLRHAHAT